MDSTTLIGQLAINMKEGVTGKISGVVGVFTGANAFVKIVGFISLIVIVYLSYYFFKRYIKYTKENPIWFKNGIDGKLERKIKEQYLIKSKDSNQFTYHFFLYVSDWDYNIYWYKPILVKSMNLRDFSPLVTLNPVKNDLSASVTTESGAQYTLNVEDFPLKKWTHVGVVANEKIFEIYINGLLAQTTILDRPVKYNNGDLLIFPWNGVGGYMSNLAYTNRAVTAKQMYNFSRRPVFGLDVMEYITNPKLILKNIDVCAESYDKPSESQLDTVDVTSLKVFGTLTTNKGVENVKKASGNLFNRVKNMMESASTGAVNTDNICPNDNDAPLCPVGTLACESNQRYCYYPDRNIMVSTYFNEKVDYCPSKNSGNVNGNKPFQIGGVNVWEKQRGKDTNQCKNIR
jgi:hypothetical protein